MSLGLTARHEYAQFGYRSLGSSGQQGDYSSNSLAANLNIGVITGQLQLGQRSDNVDRNPNVLRNQSQTNSLNLNVPLAQIINPDAPPQWAPSVAFNLSRNHTYADPSIIPSGQTLANLPNVIATQQSLNLNWTLQKLNLGLQLSRAMQDNEQAGSTAFDRRDHSQALTLAYPLSDFLNLTAGAGQRRSVDSFSGVSNRGQTAQAGLSGQFGAGYQFNINLSASHDWDSLATQDSRGQQAQLQILKSFTVSQWGLKLPGQWALNYSTSKQQALGMLPVRMQTLGMTLNLTY